MYIFSRNGSDGEDIPNWAVLSVTLSSVIQTSSEDRSLVQKQPAWLCYS